MENIWSEITRLAQEHNAVNLSTGFPGFMPPNYLTQALAETAMSKDVSLQNYTRGSGHPRLVNVLSSFYSKLNGRKIDPMNEIFIGIGADEALYCTMMGYVNPGDEVIIIEPFFDSYECFVKLAGGIPVYVPFTFQDKHDQKNVDSKWILDPDILASKFNPKTKAIIVNTPHNPTGKVFQRTELEMIADIAKKWDVLVVMDEVYEWLTYDGRDHFRMATLPGMWERTITVGSAGKTFSATGWKIGWAYGPEYLIATLQNVHNNFVGSCPTPLQEAIAIGLELEIQRLGQPECYFNQLAELLESKRNKMAKILEGVGMTPIIPEGGYFMIAKFSSIENFKCAGSHEFCVWLIKNKKVAIMPLTTFCKTEHKSLSENYVRICFAKTDKSLAETEKNLASLQ